MRVVIFLVAHLLALAAGLRTHEAAPRVDGFPGWPAHLAPLPLTAREEALAREFPGRVGRFTDGSAEIVLRWVARPTRQLHPAADCLRGAGWRVEPAPVRLDLEGRQWGATRATRGATTLEITERIHDAAGRSWPDASSWYWAALLGRTQGPWWAISEARSTR